MKEEHIFAICAYKESAYLEACIQSLKRQTRKKQNYSGYIYTERIHRESVQ